MQVAAQFQLPPTRPALASARARWPRSASIAVWLPWSPTSIRMPPARRQRLPEACWWGEVATPSRINRHATCLDHHDGLRALATQLNALGAVMALGRTGRKLKPSAQTGSDCSGADHLRLRGLDALAELAAVAEGRSGAEDGEGAGDIMTYWLNFFTSDFYKTAVFKSKSICSCIRKLTSIHRPKSYFGGSFVGNSYR